MDTLQLLFWLDDHDEWSIHSASTDPDPVEAMFGLCDTCVVAFTKDGWPIAVTTYMIQTKTVRGRTSVQQYVDRMDKDDLEVFLAELFARHPYNPMIGS